MPIAITVKTTGGEQIIGLMEGLEDRSRKLMPAFRDIALRIYAEEWMIFETEGAYRGRPAWPELSEDYAARKAKATRGGETVGAGLGILELSGKLKASLTGPNSRDSILQVTQDALYLGSKRLVESKGNAYALGFLHAAPDIPLRARVPQRESLTIVDEQAEEWGEIISEHLRQAEEAAQAAIVPDAARQVIGRLLR
jgi:hypothetical protein